MQTTRWLLVLALGALVAGACAQEASDNTYILRPGDVISITVWGLPDYSLPQVEIRPDGKVAHPFAGELVAAGKTPAALALDVTKALSEKELKDPRVTASVVQFRQDSLTVGGAVAKPGAVVFRDRITVEQAIAQAGGLGPNADSTSITLTADGQTRALDLRADAWVVLKSGCMLYVSDRKPLAILGAVKNPGILGMPPGGRLSDAIALAGGLLPDADASAGVLARAGQAPIAVDFARILADVNDPANVLLHGGDAINVPSRQSQTVAVLGAVATPGVKTFDRGSRVSNAVAQAGGLLKTADAEAATLMRSDGTLARLNLRELMAGTRPDADPMLKANDVILVPELKLPVVVVVGAVRTPGSFTLQPDSRVWDALATAGGLDAFADRTAATMIHADGKNEPVDLAAILERKDAAANAKVSDRDMIIIRSLAEAAVWVSGPVNKPGRYTLAEVKRVSDLVTVADRKPEASDEATLAHADGKTVTLNLREVLARKASEADPALQNGDTLTIASAALNVTVGGAVVQPGKQLLRIGDRFTDAIVAAGDLTPDADRRRATITRASGEALQVNPDVALARRAEASNPELQDGDSVFVFGAQNLVFVQGEVAKPGTYMVKPGERFSSVIARAGGLLPATRAKTAALQRADKVLSVDLDLAINRADVEADVALENGDSVVIQAPPLEEATVLGRVTSSQKLALAPGDRVSHVIARAGGLAPDADQRRASIMRADGTVLEVDLAGVLQRRDPESNLLMKAGDTLLVGAAIQGYVAILGDVKMPGLYPIEAGQRVSDLVARAGGPLATADLKQCVLRHAAGTVDMVDLERVLNRPAPDVDLVLASGDTLGVPPVVQLQVTVLGSVNQQGVFLLAPGARVSEAIARAQGAQTIADLPNAMLLRGDGTSQKVDLAKALLERDLTADAELRSGDVVNVPAANYHISVMGPVTKPGRFPLLPKARVTDAIALAGSFKADADRTVCTIWREAEQVEVDLKRVLRDRDSTANLALVDGDTLMVHEVRKVSVAVLGKVAIERNVSLREGARLSEVLAEVRGLRPEADAEHIQITRGAEKLVIDARAWLAGQTIADDLVMQDRDVVNVPESPHVVTVTGYVNRPGVYHFKPGDTVIEVQVQAGGFMAGQSAPQRAVLVRMVDGKQVAYPVSLTAIPTNPKAKQIAMLQDGDTLFVPPRSSRNLNELVKSLFPVASIYNVLN